MKRSLFVLLAVAALGFSVAAKEPGDGKSLQLVEATIDDIHAAYKSGQLTCRQLVQMYLDRIEAFDKKSPAINGIITINSDALKEAEQLDAAYKASGPVGPLHGIPVIVKDQADVKGMPTTLGSVLFKDYYPDRDSFVAENLRKRARLFWRKPPSVNWAAAIRMARSSVRRVTPTISSARWVVLPVVPRLRFQQISRRWAWDRKAWRRSAGRRPGTASRACAPPPALSAAAAFTAVGRKFSAPSARWRAP